MNIRLCARSCGYFICIISFNFLIKDSDSLITYPRNVCRKWETPTNQGLKKSLSLTPASRKKWKLQEMKRPLNFRGWAKSQLKEKWPLESFLREGKTDKGIKERRHGCGGNNDVSKGKSRTRAMHLKDGTWSIEGKMWRAMKENAQEGGLGSIRRTFSWQVLWRWRRGQVSDVRAEFSEH